MYFMRNLSDILMYYYCKAASKAAIHHGLSIYTMSMCCWAHFCWSWVYSNIVHHCYGILYSAFLYFWFCTSSIGRFLEPPFRSQEPFPLPPAILDDVTSVSGSGNGSWLLNGGSKNLPVFRLSGPMYIGMSPLAQVDQIPWPGDRQTVECGQHLGTWWRVCHFFFLFFF